MDVNFNPLTGFKRPHPGAEEEPQRTVRARPESALGQGRSTSGGGEPDAPLPAPGHLSAWMNSLPSFNFLPDTDWETPPASPTRSMKLSTILSELQGESAQELDTAPAPPPASPMTSGALSAIICELQGEPAQERYTAPAPSPANPMTFSWALSAMIREVQGQPEELQDTATSVFRQESDTGRPVSVFAGHATEEMEAFDIRSHLPMNRTGEALLGSQNAPVPQQAPRLPRGGEPDASLPDLGNLSAWADSLPSFNFPPNADWETPPASPMTSEAISAMIREHQGEPAQGRDTALEPPPASPMTSGALSAMLRELQNQPEVLLDAATSVFRQESDAGRPAPVFAGHATVGMEAFDLRGHLPMNPTGDTPPSPMENLSAWADSLLSFNDSPASTEVLPTGSRDAEELFAIQGQSEALQGTATSAQGSDAGRPAPAFAGDATGVDAAHQGRQNTRQNPLHRNLLAAREHLTAGTTFAAAARELNISKSTLAYTFDHHGHLMINSYGKTLLRSRDEQVARQAQPLPRALAQVDLDRLAQALRNNVGREPSQLHTALQDLPNPVAKEALAFLVDADGLRADRLALLPDAQRQALEAAHQGRPLQNPLHRNFLAARERLAAGATLATTARELNIPTGTLANTFDHRGRLLICDRVKALLQSRDATVAQQAQRLPRALTRTDLDKLIQALGDNADREPRQLLAALRNSPNPVTREALAFLVDTGGLRADRLALLPDEQRQALEAAQQGRQRSMPRNFLTAQQRLAAGATFIAVARELNIPKGTLTHIFDHHGHLLISRHGSSLLRSRDAQVARQAQQLPRALVRTDLNKLIQALRDNAGRRPWQLHTALRNLPNPVAPEALAFLVDAGGLRADRLAQLPDVQRQELEAAHQGRQSTRQNPLHRNLLAARQRLAAGATPIVTARELNINVSTLTSIFNRHGHLMINSNGKTLLRSRDEQVARQAQQLPRALVRADLNRLTQALRDNAGREPSQLHTALPNLPNPVAKEVLEFLVEAGGLRADRLAQLPDEQRRELEAAWQAFCQRAPT